ncbi:MAG: Hsp70 family protein [Rubripirellula sp.]
MSKHSKPVPIVGIDLGTTRSVIAHVDESGRPTTLLNSEGDSTTPSVVLFEDDCIVVGKEAVKAIPVLPEQVAQYAKREMGNATYSRNVNGQTYPPEMIQSLVLGKLRRDAETRLGMDVQQAVITVPAYFNEPKRRSTMDAGLLAGLDVRAVINEPTAAAIAYGVDQLRGKSEAQTVLVYDLGGGTFDASIVKVERSDISVLATDGNAMLGGVDWDKCLSRWIDAQFAMKTEIQPSQREGGEEYLLREAEDIKHALTSRKRVGVRLAFKDHRMVSVISREEFNDMTAHLLDRTRFTIRKLVSDAGLTWIEIDKVILVGGGTRMPQVREMLLRESGMEPDSSVSADEAVAHGAAIYAARLRSDDELAASKGKPGKTGQTTAAPPSGPIGKLKLVDVNAHNLGVLGVDTETSRKCNHVMIARNTALPAAHSTRFETIRDNQPSVAVEVVEGGDARGQHSTRIGRCVIKGLPPNLPAGTPVDVEFRYDTDGLIHVKATMPITGQVASLEIDRAAGLSSEDIGTMRDIHLALGLDPEE